MSRLRDSLKHGEEDLQVAHLDIRMHYTRGLRVMQRLNQECRGALVCSACPFAVSASRAR
jgi:hypothetical protein